MNVGSVRFVALGSPIERRSNCRSVIMCVYIQENASAAYCGYISTGNREEVVRIDADGWGSFTCPQGSLQVWVKATADNSTEE